MGNAFSEYNDHVSDEGLKHVGLSCPNLRELSLIRCREVSDKGVEYIAKGLSDCFVVCLY